MNATKPQSNLVKNCNSGNGQYTGCDLPGEADLLSAGWEKRFIADPQRAAEAVDTYGELGYEVCLRPVNVDELDEACAGCKVLFQHFQVVYTRKKSPAK